MFDWKSIIENFFFGGMFEAILHWPILFLLNSQYTILYMVGCLSYIGAIAFAGLMIYCFAVDIVVSDKRNEGCATMLGAYLAFYLIYTHPI